MLDTLTHPTRTARRCLCLLRGHDPHQETAKGRYDRIEAVPAGRRSVPARVEAELERCDRCGCRRLVLDSTPLEPVAHHITRWVAP